MSTDYDVSKAFKRIENELIDSMMRNLSHHKAEELAEGFNWEQWQTIQLKELEKYRLDNADKFTDDFADINKRVEDAFNNFYTDASTKEEAKILDMIRKGKFKPDTTPVGASFFGINEGKLNHLIEATKYDFTRGEQSILRVANDEYRKIIFNAQMYASTGATYEQAVDMATKDFLKNGIQNIVYKNGAKHTMADYSRMAIRTGNKRAYLMGEGDVHDKYGIHTVRVNKRQNACPKCVRWLGRVLVDDVYAGGTAKEATQAGVPLLSQAMADGFLHPNCKDIYSMYIDGISKPAQPWTKKEIQDIADKYNDEEAYNRAVDMAESYERLKEYSLDPANKQRYEARYNEWQARADALKGGVPDVVEPPKLTEYQVPIFKNGGLAVAMTKQLGNVTGKQGIPKPLVPPKQTYTAIANGKTVSMKPLGKQIAVKDMPFEKKLTPHLDDYQAYIKQLEKAKVDDATLKPILEKAVAQADKEIAQLQASGATKQKIGGIGTKKSFIEKKIKVIDTKAEISDLNTKLATATANKEQYELLNDAGYAGIWKQPVYLSEFDTYQPKIKAKKDYFSGKMYEWHTKGVSQYGKTQAEVDAKIAQLQKQLDDVTEYEAKGTQFKADMAVWENLEKQLQADLDTKTDELFKLEHPKQWAKQHSAGKLDASNITQDRRDKAHWAQSPREADNILRQKSGEVWQKASELEKDAIYEYTVSYHKFNEPLRGIEYGTNDYKGVGKTNLNPQHNGEYLDAMTDIIDKSSYNEDMWFQRGVGYHGMDKFFGVSDNLWYGTEKELQDALLGTTPTEYGFMSMGSSKGSGFSGGIILNIFVPKGTKMMYVEPFSGFGHGDGRSWDGISKQRSFGGELETILQQGTQFRVVKVEKSYGDIYIDLDVIDQLPPQRWKK